VVLFNNESFITMILFPCEYNDIKKVDDNFLREYNACQTLNIDTALFDHDKFVNDGKLITNLEKSDVEIDIILRGWMLNKTQYYNLYQKLFNRKYKLINNPIQYLHCHYFPNVLKDIRKFTPETKWFYQIDICDDLLRVVHSDLKSDVIIKDFVKSEKGNPDGLFKISKNIGYYDFDKFIQKFIAARFPLFEEGIVLKEFVELKKDGLGNTNEWRAFYKNGTLVSLDPNSNQQDDANKPDNFYLYEVSKSITKSKFFTIDVAEKENGQWIVLECGDGQVSGLTPKTNELEYYEQLIK